MEKGDLLVNKHTIISWEEVQPKMIRFKGREKARINKIYATSGGGNYLMMKLLFS